MVSHGFGRYAWAVRTRGILTSGERLRLVVTIVGSGPKYVYHRFFARRRRQLRRNAAGAAFTPPSLPDAIEDLATREAAARQSPGLTQHGLRTWRFGYALACLDGRQNQFDPRLFYLAALFHDAGLMDVEVGECFTVRSAAVVAEAARAVGGCSDEDVASLQDAVVDHVNPGIHQEMSDRLLAVYVQQGTMADLTGFRIKRLPQALVQRIVADHPRSRFGREVCGRWRAEACAAKHGRAWLLNRWGRITWFFAHPPRELRHDAAGR